MTRLPFFSGVAVYLALLLAIPQPAYAALTDNLVSFWEMEEASGTRVDTPGTMDLTDHSVTSQAGIQGNAGDFEASSLTYLDHVDDPDLSMGDIDFTFQVWVKPETVTGFPVILKKGNAGNSTREYILFLDGATPQWQVGNGTGTSQRQWSGALTAGNWYHIVFWHDAAANETGITVNNGTPITGPHSGGVLDASGAFQLGAGVDQSLYWDGLIDQVGLWKRKLTSSEITELYNSGNGLSYAAMSSGAATPCVIGGGIIRPGCPGDLFLLVGAR